MPLKQNEIIQEESIEFLNWIPKISDFRGKSLSFSSSVENVDNNAPSSLFF